jgi:hypothetical protein
MPYTNDISIKIGERNSVLSTETLNYLAPTGFKLLIDGLTYPNTEYNVQTMALPELSVSGAEVYSGHRNFAMTGEKITYGQMTVAFLVDEEMQNYKEIHDWLIAMATQADSKQDGKVRDVTLAILNSSNNVNKEIKFVDAFPVDLSSLPFDLTATDIEYLTATVTFQYSYFKIL